jgi:uncharacterized protein YeaO (DUF488 family)
MLKVKRVYEPKARGDGHRILVDRLWPRGLSKAKAGVDEWRKDLAPSDGLRRWFSHDAVKWDEFRQRYRRELEALGKIEDLREIGQRAQEGNVTLLFGAKETEHNDAVALREMILAL